MQVLISLHASDVRDGLPLIPNLDYSSKDPGLVTLSPIVFLLSRTILYTQNVFYSVAKGYGVGLFIEMSPAQSWKPMDGAWPPFQTPLRTRDEAQS
jgi:hypothetical protein